MYKATVPQHKRLAEGKYHGPKAGPRKAYKGKQNDNDADDVPPAKKRKRYKKTPKVGARVTLKPSKAGQKPITYTKGGLHKATGTPQGEKIPKSKFRGALSGKYGAAAKKKAELAHNVFHVSAKGGKKRKGGKRKGGLNDMRQQMGM